MLINTRADHKPTEIERKATSTARTVADKYGIRDRAKNTFFAMSNELLEELQPAIQAQAKTDADMAAKTRLKDIMALPEAAERRDLAQQLAIDTDSSVEQIKSILATSPVAKAYHDPLATLMKGRSPGISSDDGSPEEGDDRDDTEAAAKFIMNAGVAV